jgi:homoaconitase/3-isopropylmalate dehydratase large subunit
VLGITDDHEVAVSAHFVGRGRAGSELETHFARGVEAASAAIQGRLIQDRPSIICA